MGSMVVVYRKKNYKIYSAGKDGYIVHNSACEFSGHHSHIKNFHTCTYIIDLCVHKTVPHHLSDYLLESILRLSNDRCYQRKIEEKLEENKKKKETRRKGNEF